MTRRRTGRGIGGLGRSNLTGPRGWITLAVMLVALGFYVADRRNTPPLPTGAQTTESRTEARGLDVAPATPQQPPPPTAPPGSTPRPSVAVAPASPQLFLGNPSDARPDPNVRNNFLLVRAQYALSFNDEKGTANWVSWRLRSADMGDAPRPRLFQPDPLLPPRFFRAASRDYSNSGFDRGHLCPNSDRDATVEMAEETFFLTNIIPQSPNVNQRSWAMLEVYTRKLAENGNNTLFVVAGPNGRGGSGTKGQADAIARDRITVPAEVWKVIVVVPTAMAGDPALVGPNVRVIAVRMPNDESLTTLEWAGFRTSVADIEKATGLRFFTNLRAEVADALRKKKDTQVIPVPETPRYLR